MHITDQVQLRGFGKQLHICTTTFNPILEIYFIPDFIWNIKAKNTTSQNALCLLLKTSQILRKEAKHNTSFSIIEFFWISNCTFLAVLIRIGCKRSELSMQTGNKSPRIQVEVFHITYYLIFLTGDASIEIGTFCIQSTCSMTEPQPESKK